MKVLVIAKILMTIEEDKSLILAQQEVERKLSAISDGIIEPITVLRVKNYENSEEKVV